jgi:hypothetical protein
MNDTTTYEEMKAKAFDELADVLQEMLMPGLIERAGTPINVAQCAVLVDVIAYARKQAQD